MLMILNVPAGNKWKHWNLPGTWWVLFSHNHLKPPPVIQKARAALNPSCKTQGDAAMARTRLVFLSSQSNNNYLKMPSITVESWTGAHLEMPRPTAFYVMKRCPSHWSKPRDHSTAPFLTWFFLWQQSVMNTEAEIQPQVSHQERFYSWNGGRPTNFFIFYLNFLLNNISERLGMVVHFNMLKDRLFGD